MFSSDRFCCEMKFSWEQILSHMAHNIIPNCSRENSTCSFCSAFYFHPQSLRFFSANSSTVFYFFVKLHRLIISFFDLCARLWLRGCTQNLTGVPFRGTLSLIRSTRKSFLASFYFVPSPLLLSTLTIKLFRVVRLIHALPILSKPRQKLPNKYLVFSTHCGTNVICTPFTLMLKSPPTTVTDLLLLFSSSILET